MKYIKLLIASIFSLIVTIGIVVFFGMAAGFWFKFAKLGFDAASNIMSNFL